MHGQGSLGARPPRPQASTDLPPLQDIFCGKGRTLKYVPGKAKSAWATVLAGALAVAVAFNTAEAWQELAMLPGCVLRPPPYTQNKNSKASQTAATNAYVLDRISQWQAGERLSLWEDTPRPQGRGAKTNRDEMDKRLEMAEALCREGLDGKACRALESATLVAPSREAFVEMRRLHPPADVPQPSSQLNAPLPPVLSPALVDKILRQFPKGTRAGPSGLRVQHLVDAMSSSHKSFVLESSHSSSDHAGGRDCSRNLGPEP